MQNQNNGQQQQNNNNKILNIILRLVIGVVLFVVIYKAIGVFSGNNFRSTLDGVDIKNGVYSYSSEASVTFYPECPKCGHKETSKVAYLSDGESKTYPYVCNSCFETYEITVKR